MSETVNLELTYTEAKLVAELLRRTYNVGMKDDASWSSQRKSEVALTIMERMKNGEE